MFRVNRSSLLSDVWSQSRTGSALITGSPGTGKSWLVAQIVRTCKREKRPHLAIIAEDYPVNSLEELRLALGFKTDILTFLRSLADYRTHRIGDAIKLLLPDRQRTHN